MKLEALVTVWFMPYQGVGEPEPTWTELCQFVAGGDDQDDIRRRVERLEPELRRQAFRRIDRLQFQVEPLDRLRGLYGHLLRALKDQTHATKVVLTPGMGRRSPRGDEPSR